MNLRAMAIGLIWAGLSALSPVVVSVAYDIKRNEFTNWEKVKWESLVAAGGGTCAYWRKHKALLKMPPFLEGIVPPDA